MPRVSVGVEGGLWFTHPSAKASVFPEATFELYARPHNEEAQFEVYLLWTRVGGVVLGAETELETPRVKVSPRVSVGVEGGLWPYHPSAKARVLPAVTEEVNASPHEAELQFEL